MTTNGRSSLLERYGRFYGDEHFAIAFTAGITGLDAKRVTTKGWNNSRPLADGDYAAGLIAERGQQRNVAIVLRPSNLIVLECDSEQDLVAIEDLDLPPTLTVRSSEPYKRHFYFHPPEDLGTVPYVAFRFESGRVTADSGRYFLAPPSIHPSGAQYQFLPGLGPDDTDIAELSEDTYLELINQAQEQASEQRERIQVDPDAKIQAGQRRETLFRFACMLRRWGRPYQAILDECQRFNEERCQPPVARELVEVQVQGAMKKEGDQELATRDQPETWQPLTAQAFLDLPEPAGVELLGPLVLRGGRTIIGGDSGHGKTTLAFAIAAAILTGNELLGQTGAGEGPVLIVDLEQGVRSIKRGIREAGLENTDTHILNLADGLALDQNQAELSQLEHVIEQLNPVLVILDPYYKAHRGDANEERGVTDLMRNLDRLRTDHGFALILPAHVRKEQQTAGPRKLTLADIAGSGAISRGAEIVIALERLSHGEARLRYLKDREGELPVGDHLDLTYTQDDGFQIKERPTSLSIEEQILAVEDSGWLIVKEWARMLGLRDQETARVLKRLAEAGKIVCETGPEGRRHNSVCYSTSAVPRIPELQGTAGTAGANMGCSSAGPASLLGEADRSGSTAPGSATVPFRNCNDDIPF